MPSESNALDFFQALRAAFDLACARWGMRERFFKIGVQSVRLCFASEILAARLTRALEHLAVAPTAHPALRVFLWDDVTTETQLPPLPWTNDRDVIQAYNTRRFFTSYHEENAILSMLDAEMNTALFWTRDARRLPSYEWCAPLRHILHWFFMQRGGFVLHGGAIGMRNGGVVLAGKGGSGKSTTAIASLMSSLNYAGDDYCLVLPAPEPRVYSLYASAKLHRSNLERLLHIRSSIANADALQNEKAVALLYPRWAEKLILELPVRAILLPRMRGGTQTTLSAASTADAIKSLTLSTVTLLPRTDALAVQRINALVNTLPCYWLELGTEIPQIPNVIAQLLQRANA